MDLDLARDSAPGNLPVMVTALVIHLDLDSGTESASVLVFVREELLDFQLE